MTDTDTFATRFRAARQALGLTQAQAAAAIGCTRSYVGQIETGERVPTLDRMLEMAQALGIDPHALSPHLASTRRGGRASRLS